MNWQRTFKFWLINSLIFISLILLVYLTREHLAQNGWFDANLAITTLVLYWFIGIILILISVNLRQRWREFLLVLLSFTVMLLLLEFSLRIFFPQFRGVRSTELHHIYPSNSYMYMGVYEDKPVFVQTNKDGLRTTYSPAEFLSYQDRIVVLGDSFTFGLGVQQEKTFPELMEQQFRQRLNREDIAVLNAGVISYSPFLEELLMTKRLVDYQPTQVILFLDATDIGDDIKYAGQARYEAGSVYFNFSDNEDNLLYYMFYFDFGGGENSNLYSELYILAYSFVGPKIHLIFPYFFMRYNRYYYFKIEVDGVVEYNRFFIFRHPREKIEPYLQNTLDNINRVATAAKKMGAEFILVVSPRYQHWNPAESPENWEAARGDYRLDEPFQDDYIDFFVEQQETVDYPIFNLLLHFKATDQFPLVFKKDPHWNEVGHAFVANTMVDYLLRNQVIE